jgi:23S rRNA (cytosine1962-C5)-methyltransferase
MAVLVSQPQCVIYEDEHVLGVNKPAGLNTHSPSPYAGEGIYEWLRNREPRWAQLAIVHRLDKATSGVMIFAKTKLANKSLTEQFTNREIHKNYLLLTSKAPDQQEFTMRTSLRRAGDKYRVSVSGDWAETKFQVLGKQDRFYLLRAEPLTGRTHQIRVHCEEMRCPILGDTLYGGEPFPRICLHAEQLRFRLPDSGKELELRSEVNFLTSSPAGCEMNRPPYWWLRHTMLGDRTNVTENESTNAYRLIHGASDDASIYLDVWGWHLLAQSEKPLSEKDLELLRSATEFVDCRGMYHKLLNRQVARTSQQESAPQLLFGLTAPPSFQVKENGVAYEISFAQGYSVGLFLDQRDNRRRLLVNHIAADFPVIPGGLSGRLVLNTFAYTCGFSVCAALAGAKTTSLDLSKKYLEWGQRNFRLNQLNPEEHDFIYGDVFDWAPRLQKKGRTFDVVILDPPTFSRSKDGVFQAERYYGKLVTTILPLLNPGGVLFAATNVHKLAPEDFIEDLQQAITDAGRTITQMHYVPQPLDFPISKEEPGYLKTLWMRVA